MSAPRPMRIGCCILILTFLTPPAPLSFEVASDTASLQTNALALHATPFKRIYQGAALSIATLAFMFSVMDRPSAAQTPLRSAPVTAQQATSPVVDEAWLVKDFLGSARIMYSYVAVNDNLNWGELSEWIRQYVTRLNPEFANRERANREASQKVTRTEWHLFWGRLLREVLEPSGYIVYPWAYEGRLQVGRVMAQDMWTSPRGERIPVRILHPLVGTFANVSTDYILLPESFTQRDPKDGDLIERIKLLLNEGWLKSNLSPKYSGVASVQTNLSDLRDWMAFCLVLLRNDSEAARRIFQETDYYEELGHADLDRFLRPFYNQTSSYAMDLDQWYEALRDRIFLPDWEKRLAEENIYFAKMTLLEKRLFIERRLEYHAQLLTLKLVEQATFAWLKFNLTDDPVHGPATVDVRERLSPYILGRKTSNLEVWITALIRRLTEGLDDPTLTDRAREQRLRDNINRLNATFHAAVRDIYQEEFRYTGEATANPLFEFIFEPIRYPNLLIPPRLIPKMSPRRKANTTPRRQRLFRRSA